jgi:NAD(P)-dependent dehydrogenase (short-subunit alcohol dehydrogenase family)
MHDTPVALVTGADKGIGLQIAKDLALHGFTVLVGSRNLENGETAAKGVGGNARAVQLDVTDQASSASAAERIRNEFGRLDVLVNNAGISHAPMPDRSLEQIVQSGRLSVASLAEIHTVFETNVFGVIAVTQAMLPLLREAPAARVVNVASSGGSLALNSDPSNPHRDVRHVLRIKSGSQRSHGRLRRRPRSGRHQGQRRMPWLHQHRPQLLSWHAHGSAGGTRTGAPCAHRLRWTNWHVL